MRAQSQALERVSEPDRKVGENSVMVRKHVIALAVSFFILNVFDAISTVLSINAGNVELNPIMNNLLENDVTTFLLFKISIGTALAVYFALRNNRTVNVVLVISVFAYFATVVNNTLLFLVTR
jgi:hypothetical protein